MKSNFIKKAIVSVLGLASVAIIGVTDISAQNFDNTATGVYNASCSGVIKMKAADGTITGNNLGTSTLAIPGVVDWNTATAGQRVRAYYYSHLVVTGAAKTMDDGIHVTGDACPTPIAGYEDLAFYPFYVSGTPTLSFGTGTFYYSGGSQNIYPTLVPYNILNISSAGIVRNDETVAATTVTTTGTVDVAGTLTIGTGTSNFGAGVTISGEGIVNAGTTGTTTFASTLDLTGTTSTLNVLAGDVAINGATTTADGTTIQMTGTGDLAFGTGGLNLSGDLIGGDGALSLAGVTGVTATGTITTGDGTTTITNTLTSAGTITTAGGDVTNSSTTTLTGNGTLTLADAGNVTLDGLTTTGDGTIIQMTGAGNLTFGTGGLTLNGMLDADSPTGGLGILDLNGTTAIGATGSVYLGNATQMFITGDITNAGDANNLNFTCSSIITYDGVQNPQSILTTLSPEGKSYGNLILTGGNKRGASGNGNNINICSDFSLDGGNLDMLTSTGTLRLNSTAATVTYGASNAITDLEEVNGKMERATDATGRIYLFNNSQTSIELASVATNPTSMIMDVRPSVGPYDYEPTTDINRKINLTYSGNDTDDDAFKMDLKVAYLYDEGPNNWATYAQNKIRMYEATVAPDREKISTLATADRVDAVDNTSFGTISLAQIGNTATATVPNNIKYIASGNDVLLSAGPTTFYSVRDGRWTNPNTWDENTTPTATDNVEIRSFVFAGIDAPLAGVLGGADETAGNNTLKEATVYPGNVAVANKIEVADIVGSSLFIGNEDNGTGWVFKTALATGNTLINSNTTAMGPAFGTNGIGTTTKATFNTNNTNANNFNGIWITPWGAPDVTAVKTHNIENKGTFNNEGVVEIGEE